MKAFLQRYRYWLLAILLLAVAAVSAGTYARVLEGDMEVAGRRGPPLYSPAPVLGPRPDFSYACRAELSDGFEYRERMIQVDGEKRPYDLYAYADFTIDNKNYVAQSQMLPWRWVAVVDDEQSEEGAREIPLAKAPADAFSLAGHVIGISEYGQGDELQAALRATVKLPAGEFYRQETKTAAQALKDGKELRVQVEAQLSREGTPRKGETSQLWRRLYVRCTKVK